jgi:hypothetical protein
MKTRTKILGSILSSTILLGALSGCDDPNSSAMRPRNRQTTAGSSAVASSQTNDSSAVSVAYPTTPPSVLLIDGNEIQFPAAKLAVMHRGTGGYVLRLCTDDPPTAIDPGYAGNSYVLDLWVPIDRISNLPGYQMDYKPSPDDSVSGIFLHGFREQLHVLGAHLLFQKDGDGMVISITGQCERTDPRNPAARPQRVTLSAHLQVDEPTD